MTSDIKMVLAADNASAVLPTYREIVVIEADAICFMLYYARRFSRGGVVVTAIRDLMRRLRLLK